MKLINSKRKLQTDKQSNQWEGMKRKQICLQGYIKQRERQQKKIELSATNFIL